MLEGFVEDELQDLLDKFHVDPSVFDIEKLGQLKVQ